MLALPGVILNGPIFLLASIISRKKAKGMASISDHLYSGILNNYRACRGVSRFGCKNCGKGCPCNMEDPHFPWGCSTFVRFLCFPCNCCGHKGKCSLGMENLDTFPCHVSLTIHWVCCLEVRRGRYGRIEVSVSCVVYSSRF